MSATIHKEVTINADSQRVYDALTSAKGFSAFSNAPAEIAREAGGAFSCFGGMITGRNVELVPNKRIVQAWRAGNWPEGVFSIVRFELGSDGGSTKIAFDHTGFPAEMGAHLEAGWQKMYFEPLKKYLG